ncbi:hypothetical protein NDN08_007558 [Rhodosorus marinus]|uniref:Ribosome biogenesis protein NOP53 n=1 Tax=Rhodosorus marinus TaxID=101924 RepID=A0AAV8V246_9RHOD|nr:hypothetical protein NDN08_007558 [Rhodosorus marinus]
MNWWLSVGGLALLIGLLYGGYVLLEKELSKPPGSRRSTAAPPPLKKKKQGKEKKPKAFVPKRVEEGAPEMLPVPPEDPDEKVFGGKITARVIDLADANESEWRSVRTVRQDAQLREARQKVADQKKQEEEAQIADMKKAEKNRRRRENKKEMDKLVRELQRQS